MPAHVRSDIWQLLLVDLVVSVYSMIESLLPVICDQWSSLVIKVKNAPQQRCEALSLADPVPVILLVPLW